MTHTPDTSPGEQGRPGWSVVVPAYNRAEPLQACLEALARATPPTGGFEVVVVDDGSMPPLGDRIQPPAGLDLRLLRFENGGPAKARNRGAQAARGRWLAFTDDDCRPRPDWLIAFERAIGDTDAALLGGHTVNILHDCLPACASQELHDYLYRYYNTQSERPLFFASNNIAITRDAYAALGGFDTSFPLAAGEDRDFCDRAIKDGLRLIYAPDAVIDHAHAMTLRGFYRQHFNYGRGAYILHQARSKRDATPVALERFRFYVNLLVYPLRDGLSVSALGRCALMGLSQLAHTAGYARQRRASR